MMIEVGQFFFQYFTLIKLYKERICMLKKKYVKEWLIFRLGMKVEFTEF